MSNSIFVDWSAAQPGWEFTGSDLARQRAEEKLAQCPHGNAEAGFCDQCYVYPDERAEENMPVTNYAYPAERFSNSNFHSSFIEEAILEIIDRTNCTVVYNNEDNIYYLALSGGGMDLSQDIALAYIIAQGQIPHEWINDINIQCPISVNEKDFRAILNNLRERITLQIKSLTMRNNSITNALNDLEAK